MAYRTRSARRLSRKGKLNLFFTAILIVVIIYASINWILPILISSLGFITRPFKSSKEVQTVAETTLAPPVLTIPYEATNTASIDINGYATAGSKVKIYLDDELKGEVEVADDGIFSIKNIELSIGTNNIYGKTIDEKDQESLASKTIRLIYDNEKPPLEISEPEDGKLVQGERKLKVSGKTEPEALVLVNNSQIITNSEGNFSTILNLNDGENTITIKAQDKALNSTEVVHKVTFQP